MPTGDSRGGETAVVDASAVLAVLMSPGADAEAIARRIATCALIAPSLLPFEVANVLRRRRNGGLLSPTQADQALGQLLRLSIDLWDWDLLARRSWQLGNNLTTYDASYVALAELTGSPLITRDARIAAAPGIRCMVELV